MLPDAALPVPASLMTLLAVFSPLFTAPSFRTFTALACGFLAQSGKRTVCGMLTGAGLSRAWPHDRAHYFFSRARWNPDDLGICVAKLVIGLLVPAGETVELLIDDTLFRRRGKRVFAASWFHDGAAQGPAKTGYGNNWVVLAVRVWLPMTSRPVAIPVMAKLVIKDTTSSSRLWLARRMVTRLAAELPGREINVTADSAYAGEELKQLPDGVTWTTRLRANAALYDLPPARTGKKGRPRKKGNRLPSLAKIAAAAAARMIPARAWHRMRTGSGTKGTRHYDWAMLGVTSDDTPEGHGDGHSVLLARRHRYTGQLSYYRCWTPGPVPLSKLIAIASARWRIEEDHQLSKQAAGLDSGQVIRWKSWHRWTAVCLLAYIYLAVAVALQREQDASSDLDAELIPVTVPELLRLLRDVVIPPPRRDRAHRLHWSEWRRRHQHRARQAHQRWNAYAEATP